MLNTAPSSSFTDGETDNSTCNTYTGQDIMKHEAASILLSLQQVIKYNCFFGIKTGYTLFIPTIN